MYIYIHWIYVLKYHELRPHSTFNQVQEEKRDPERTIVEAMPLRNCFRLVCKPQSRSREGDPAYFNSGCFPQTTRL